MRSGGSTTTRASAARPRATGWRPCSRNSNVANRYALVYLLIYSSKSSSRPGAFHKLKVDVKSPGAKVVARSGYYEPRQFPTLTRLEQVLSAGDFITGGALRAVKVSDDERGGGRKRRFTFSTAGLSPGRHALKVVVTDSSRKLSAESSSAFEVK